MAVVNATPQKTLQACNASEGAVFLVGVSGCDLQFLNQSSLPSITNIEYEITSELGTVVDTVNTTDTTYTWDKASLFPSQTLSIKQTITSGLGTFEYTLSYGTPAFEGCYIEFQSNLAGASTFDPSTTYGAGDTMAWLMPNETILTGPSQSVLGSTYGFDGTTKTIRMHCDIFSSVSDFDVNTDNIVGTLDLRLLTGCDSFRMNANPGLTSIISPASTVTLTEFWAQSCGLTGGIDLTPFGSNFGGTIQLNDNPFLTAISNPTSSNTVSIYYFYNCNITGAFDFSGLSGLAGNVWGSGNANMTSLITPTSSGTIGRWWFFSCNLTGIQNWSGLSGWGGDIRFYSNPNMTGLTAPTSSTVITRFWAYLCNFTTLNLSTLTGLGGDFIARQNSNMTSITFPSTSQDFTGIQVDRCNLSSLDLSPISGNIGGAVRGYQNASLSTVTFPGGTSTSEITSFWFYSCALTSLNLSYFADLAGDIRFYSNSSLSSLTLPGSSTNDITFFHCYNCDLPYFDLTGLIFNAAIDFLAQNNSMTAAEVNCILVDADATFPNSGSGTITIDGTNAAPDTTSGGCNGSGAATNMASEGYTVNTS